MIKIKTFITSLIITGLILFPSIVKADMIYGLNSGGTKETVVGGTITYFITSPAYGYDIEISYDQNVLEFIKSENKAFSIENQIETVKDGIYKYSYQPTKENYTSRIGDAQLTMFLILEFKVISEPSSGNTAIRINEISNTSYIYEGDIYPATINNDLIPTPIKITTSSNIDDSSKDTIIYISLTANSLLIITVIMVYTRKK